MIGRFNSFLFNPFHSNALICTQRLFSSTLTHKALPIQLFIKNVSCAIPGHTNKEEGELVSTKEMIFNLQKKESIKKIDLDFLIKGSGIESIAMTRTTADFVRKHWAMDSERIPSSVFCEGQSTPNLSLHRMLRQSIETCLEKLKKENPSFDCASIVAHIHIAPVLSPHMEVVLASIRKDFEIGRKSSIGTLILQQGCSGLLMALETAKNILRGKSAESNVLITSENDMMRHAHQRCRRIATSDNLNHWLWPAIFGEAVGALVVGTNQMIPEKNSDFFSIDRVELEITDVESAVAHVWKPEDQTTETLVNIKKMGENYINHIKKHAKILMQKDEGMDKFSKLCFNEASPVLTRQIKKDLSITSPEYISTISNLVGTLPGVSPFSQLDIAINQDSENSKIGVVLAGLSGDRMVAGHMSLSRL